MKYRIDWCRDRYNECIETCLQELEALDEVSTKMIRRHSNGFPNEHKMPTPRSHPLKKQE